MAERMPLYCWSAEDAACVINALWADPNAWERGERSWHRESNDPSSRGGFFSPNADGSAYCYIEVSV
jgi:hypothetical protein